jgi:hypothetical protein
VHNIQNTDSMLVENNHSVLNKINKVSKRPLTKVTMFRAGKKDKLSSNQFN